MATNGTNLTSSPPTTSIPSGLLVRFQAAADGTDGRQIGWGGTAVAFVTLAVVVVGFGVVFWMYHTRHAGEKEARRRRLSTAASAASASTGAAASLQGSRGGNGGAKRAMLAHEMDDDDI
jgi:hypothetical protein